MNWYKIARDPVIADPAEVGYKEEWGEHHGPVEYTPDMWNYGPRGYLDRSGPMPLPKTLYHVTPFPEEIMQEGFKAFTDMSRQTFGGHGEYVSFTTLENAKVYQEGLKDVARLANDEFGVWDLSNLFEKWGVPKAKVNGIIQNAWSNIRSDLSIKEEEPSSEKRNLWVELENSVQTEDAYDKLFEFLERYPEDVQIVIARIFEILHIFGSNFPLFMGTMKSLLNRLKGKSPDDIAILEAKTPPLKWRSNVNIFDEDMSERYTVNTGEQEWRVHNPQAVERQNIRRIAGNWYRVKIAGKQLLHGTSSEFEEFDLSHAGRRDWGDYGVGVYLTINDTMAKSYAQESAQANGGHPVVYLVDADVSNLAPMDDPELLETVSRETGAPFPKTLTPGEKQTRPQVESQSIRDFLIEAGYDGVIVSNGWECVVFDPSKIKILKKFELGGEQTIPFWLDK